MRVSKNVVTETTTIVANNYDLDVLLKALWDEQIMYYELIKQEKYVTLDQKSKWKEMLDSLGNMSKQLGGHAIDMKGECLP